MRGPGLVLSEHQVSGLLVSPLALESTWAGLAVTLASLESWLIPGSQRSDARA